MSRRPEILFPIFTDLTVLNGVGPQTAGNFANMQVERPKDLIVTLPTGVVNRSVQASVQDAVASSVVTVEVLVGLHQPNSSKGRPYKVMVQDAKTSFQLVFFHARADWLRKTLPSGQRRVISGKIEIFDGLLQMTHPDYVLRPQDAQTIPLYEPVYPLTAGITQKTMYKAMQSALERVPVLDEWIEPGLKEKQEWPDWQSALLSAHAPESAQDISAAAKHRQRLAYDELFAHQLTLALARAKMRRAKGVISKSDGRFQNKILTALPYRPTRAQRLAVSEVTGDMALPRRMNRLLQGDVGSGKTLVAFMALLAAVEAGGQGVFMAPTEILARQHLEALHGLAQCAGISVDILTGRDKGKSRQSKLEALARGKTHILIGTHAVFQKDVGFKDLRLAVIDEQHRFGVRQRMDLGAKGDAVDILVMTATPIPRSLALAQYGDMDVSVLDEKPAGRRPIDTVLVSTSRLDEITERLKSAIAGGRQAYWVCPLVAESNSVDLAAAEERYRSLRLTLGEDIVGLVHGQMLPKEKDAAMARFIAGKTKLLVATTVIEVGVDVPSATIMVIERAENFGLAQLHQLRGRVGRGKEASTCLLIYAPPLGTTARKRLEILRETEDGFKIAETDLQLRGAGDVLGLQQSGLPRFRIADLETQVDLSKIARDDSRMLLATDPDLTSRRGIAARVLLYLMEQEKAIRLISVG